MKRCPCVVVGFAFAMTIPHGSCTRTAPSPTITVPVPEKLEQLDPALITLIERQLRVVRSTPINARAHATLGAIYEANNLWPEARQCYETASTLEPGEPMWIHHAAIAAGTSGDFDAALALLRKGAERHPDFAPIHHRFGDALLRIGEFEEAGVAFERATATAPNYPVGYVGLGEVNLRLNRPNEAIALLERAVRLSPQDKKAKFLLGTAYREIGRDAEARELMTLGSDGRTRFLPDEWSTRFQQYKVSLAVALQTSAEHRAAGRLRLAVNVLEGALRYHSDDVELLSRLGAIYLEASRTDDALGVLLRADKIDSTNLSTCINLATCYQRLERYDEAISAADRAVKLDPSVWQAHYSIAVALLRLERWGEAKAAFESARELSPNNPTVLQQIENLQQEHP